MTLFCWHLQEAETVLGNVNVYDPNPDLYKDALKMVRMASLNCYSFEVGLARRRCHPVLTCSAVSLTWSNIQAIFM